MVTGREHEDGLWDPVYVFDWSVVTQVSALKKFSKM